MNWTAWHNFMKSAQPLEIVYFLGTIMALGSTSERRVGKYELRKRKNRFI